MKLLNSRLRNQLLKEENKRTVAQLKTEKPAAQGNLWVPRVTTRARGLLSAKQVKHALLECGIPVFKVKTLLGAVNSWLIFLDVREDFTKGTFNAEWLTAVCKGGTKWHHQERRT